ncbi:MAG: hypothetical protein KC613_23690 [Myxococcales bacterium]|nr:hypothetical protein [Myxococcales bacterium]MCB9523216.1 hypothetical protein [Myxococcales bacterium]
MHLLLAAAALLFALPAFAQEEEEPIQMRPNPEATQARGGKARPALRGKRAAVAKGEEEEESLQARKPADGKGDKALNPSRTYRAKGDKRPTEVIGVVGAGPELPGKKAQPKARTAQPAPGRAVKLHNHKPTGD